jgi:WD40 repeat protein
MSSHVLLVSRKNILSIYSLKSSKLLWTTNEFEHRKLQIHSLQSSFILICLQTKQIFQIDIKSFEIKSLTQLPIDCLLSIVTADNRLYVISKDQTTLVEFNIDNQNLTVIPTIQLKSSQIIEIYSVYNYLVFHTDDNQIHLWWKENEPISQLEKASRLITKDNRLILASTDNKTIILHDLREKLRGTIQLDDDAGQCEALGLCDNEQYLFTICHDRLLRMYHVSDGKQITKLFIHKDLYPFIGILNNRLLLKIANRLCIIKIIDKKSSSQRYSS